MANDGDTQAQRTESETTSAATSATPPPAASAPPSAGTTPPPAAASPPPGPATPPPAGVSPQRAAEPSLWPARLSVAAGATYRWVMQPRVRLALAGIIVALIGAGPASGSVWTLPLVIVGVIMLIVACIGRRLRGRFVIEWGESGAEIGFSASVTPAPERPAAPAVPVPATRASQLRAGSPAPAPPAPMPVDDDVIEGEAHTVEIDVAELKALIAAAENAENGNGPAARDGNWREVNVHRLNSTPRPAGDAEPPLRENRG